MTLFDAATPEPARVVVKMVVAYDGTDFSGFAMQRGRPIRTVGGVLKETIAKVVRHDVDLTCAGRTDTGVHAWGQVVTFETEPGLDEWRLQSAVNSMLGPEVVVRSCEIAAPGFDARYSALWRQYRYTILNRPMTDPFRDRFAWWVPEPLDLRALRLAADPFVGEHDFTSFCRRSKEGRANEASLTRVVFDSSWHDEGDGVLRYEIRARSFCWQMVRAIVGTLVEVGSGKRRPGEMLGIIRAADRSATSQLAPPRGLCLWDVGFQPLPGIVGPV